MSIRTVLMIVSLIVSVAIGLVLARGTTTASKSDPAGRAVRIGLSLDTLKEERWQNDRDMFVARANELGAEVFVQSANSDDARQLADVEGLLSRGIDVLVIASHDGRAMARAVELAHKSNVPVIAYDRMILGAAPDVYMSFDNVEVGRMQGQFMVDALGGRGTIVRIYGSPKDNNATLFKNGQDLALAPYLKDGRIKVIHEDWAENWKPENGKRILNAAISAHPNEKIDGVLASNDGTAGGAIQALSEEGRAGKVIVTGQDAELVAMQRIVNGAQTMSIYKPLKRLATRAAELSVQLARGKPVVVGQSLNNETADIPAVMIPSVVVTKDTIKDTVIKDGFHTAAAIYGDAAPAK